MESIYSPSPPSSVHKINDVKAAPQFSLPTRALKSFTSQLFNSPSETPQNTTSLRLWGLTLGVVSDFLEAFDVDAAASLWKWPTFTHLDIRLVVWLLTRQIRRRVVAPRPRLDGKRASTQEGSQQGEKAGNAKDSSSDNAQIPISRINGIDSTTYTATNPATIANIQPEQASASASSTNQEQSTDDSATLNRAKRALGLLPPSSDILDTYFGQMRRAVVIALLFRAKTLAFVVAYVVWKWRRGRMGGRR